ncbi:sialate O-acetylesterase [Lachnospiraceae bacterium XPB1003]|nr:sialate O-acetylesterase [Lachnospiraceae bacterium XPB1003]
MSNIRLSALISNGMIVQRGKKVHVWGWSDSAVHVEGCISDNKASADAIKDENEYRFDLYFDELPAGGPYELEIRAEGGVIKVSDVYSGDVFQLAGQSNIEFPMSRVRDTYPEYFEAPKDNLIRTFKVVENGNFHGPLKEVQSGSWVDVNEASLPDYSAIGFFMAKALRASEDVPVGLVNTTLGGSTIESWMSKDMLAAWPDDIKLAEKYADDAFLAEVKRTNEHNGSSWREEAANKDKGLSEKWYELTDGVDEVNGWKDIEIPSIFKEIPDLKGYIGSVWLWKEIDVPASLAGKEAVLWFGTMVDYDITYLNGEEIGRTEYLYPPRRYAIRKGLLKEGKNHICIRLGIETGRGRVTPGKLLAILTGSGKRICDGFNETVEGFDDVLDVSGTWKYKKGCSMEKVAPTDFFNWKPTALFNGMLNPCTNYPVKAVIWYQGESNAGRSSMYFDQLKSMTEGYRKLWKDDSLPVITVKLPEFDDVTYEPDGTDNIRTDWSDMQKVQEACTAIPGVYLVETAGTGEINDLHPQRKKPIGDRIAEIVKSLK